MNEYHVGCGLFGIYIGKIKRDKCGNSVWSDPLINVTDEAMGAVAQWLLEDETEFDFEYKGKRYVLKIEEAENGQDNATDKITPHNKFAKYWKDGEVSDIYSDALDEFAEVLADKIKRNEQSVIMVEGRTGAGKSTFAIHLCCRIAERLGAKFSFEEDYIIEAQDLERKKENPDATPINLIDEMGIGFKRLEDTVKKVDELDQTTILVIPSILKIDEVIRSQPTNRNRIVREYYKVHCSSREDPLLKGYGRGFFEVSRYDGSDWKHEVTGIFSKLSPEMLAEYQTIIENVIKGTINRGQEAENGQE